MLGGMWRHLLDALGVAQTLQGAWGWVRATLLWLGWWPWVVGAVTGTAAGIGGYVTGLAWHQTLMLVLFVGVCMLFSTMGAVEGWQHLRARGPAGQWARVEEELAGARELWPGLGGAIARLRREHDVYRLLLPDGGIQVWTRGQVRALPLAEKAKLRRQHPGLWVWYLECP
jgi:hypothetical protein